MPDPETIAAVSYSLLVAKAAIEQITKDIYALAKDRTTSFVRRVNACLSISAVCENLKKVRKVKTIYQLEKEIDIKHFYYKSRILVSGRRKIVNCLADMPFEGNLVIEGTVGQGKSTFLRFLTWSEATRGMLIPLFVELRKYDGTSDLFTYLLQQLKAFGLNVDEEVFSFLLETGRVALFLDGFDEIGDKTRGSLVTALDDVAKQFPQTRMIVTSRPDSDIQSSEWFRVVQLAPLIDSEYEDVIRCMVANGQEAERLIQQIEDAASMQLAFSKTSFNHLLSTPLMVALLVVKFNIEQSVPKNLCEFYKELFLVLLQRHDRSKAGFKRERASMLSDDDLQAVFDSLCFRMRRDGISSIPKAKTRSYLKELCDDEKIKADPHCILADITKITCLLVDDGGEMHFVHRSVQEFHSARYIYSQPDVHAEVFYNTIRPKWHLWGEEINFLCELDEFRFNRYFEMADLTSLLATLSPKAPRIRNKEQLFQFTGELVAEFNGKGSTVSRWVRMRPQPTWSGYKALCRCWISLRNGIAKSLATSVTTKKESKAAVWYREIVRPFVGLQGKVTIGIYDINSLYEDGKIAPVAVKPLEEEVEKLAIRVEELRVHVQAKLDKRTQFDFSKG